MIKIDYITITAYSECWSMIR